MSNLVLGVAVLALCWLVVGGALWGFGAAALRLLFPPPAAQRPGAVARPGWDALWVGWALLIFFLQLWQLAWPVVPALSFSVLGLGWLALGWAARPWRWPRLSAALLILLLQAPALAWLAVRALAEPGLFDSGQYHFQSIRWLNEFRAVPGLGNLEGRLAFNQSYFLFPAFLNVPPLESGGFHIANSLLFAVTLSQGLLAAIRLVLQRRPPAVADLLSVLLLPMVVAQVHPGANCPSPDPAIYLVSIQAFRQLAGLAWPGGETRAESVRRLALLALFCTAALTVKLSFLFLGLGMVLVGGWLAWQRGVRVERPLAIVAAICAVGLAGWLARGFVASGYPLYPSTVAGLPVDWRIPAGEAQHMAASIKGWARSPGAEWPQALHGFAWLGPWWARVSQQWEFWAQLLIGTIAAATLPLAVRWRQVEAPPPARLWLAALPLAIGLVAWFILAPDVRFAGAVPALFACWFSALWLLLAFPRHLHAAALSGALLLALAVGLGLPRIKYDRRTDWGWGKIPVAQVAEYRTASGLKIYRPVAIGQIWNHRLPTAVRGRPDLALRAPGKLQRGFRIEPTSLPPP